MAIDLPPKIIVNAARCRKCYSVIRSYHRHDFQTCKCGAVSVDGGLDYLRRAGEIEDWEELSEWVDDPVENFDE